MKELELIKPLSSRLLFAGCLMLMALPDAWAGCVKGDEKCGPDGYVLVCGRSIHTGELQWEKPIPQRTCDASAPCTEGDTKCGADGIVLTCRRNDLNPYDKKLAWRTPPLAHLYEYCGSADDACAEGDEKCGPDGYVLECKRGMYDRRLAWHSTISQCGREVCEPGIRRCRAGKVQVCSYDGERWDTEHEKCDSHDISED